MRQHLILTNGRSGSNAFVQMLNQHPAITNYGEVLGPWTLGGRRIRPLFRGLDGPARYLDWMYSSRTAFSLGQLASQVSRTRRGVPANRMRRSDVASLGIKDFAFNFERMGLEQYLPRRPHIRLIVLVRENTLARLVSTRTLATDKRVAATAGTPRERRQSPRIRFDPDTIVSELDEILRENQLLQTAFEAHAGPVLRITYEKYFGSLPEGRELLMDGLQGFLGVEPQALRLEHTKLRRDTLADSVSNFEEIKERLAGTVHSRWAEGE